MQIFRKKLQRLFTGLGSRELLNFIPDEWYIRIQYYLKYGKKLNLKDPQLFSEKLQWMKIHDRNKLYPLVVDKITARDYIAEHYSEDLLIPKLWIGENPDEIPYDSLPEKFVIKCTHGSHCNIICTDKESLDRKKTNESLRKWLKKSWYWFGREWPYSQVPPRILIEEFMDDNGKEIRDFKFFCFDGHVEFCQIISDRQTVETMDFFDPEWKRLEIKRRQADGSFYPVSESVIEKPEAYSEMVKLAADISTGFRFARVDLYYIRGKIYFGEITFFPVSGYCDFEPMEYNYYLGSLISQEECKKR